jgi:L-lactate utilization protein LutC
MAIRDLNPGTIEFAAPASDATIESVAAALRANNIEAVIVESADDAVQRVLELVPEGAEVNSGKSKTLEDIGLYTLLHDSGHFDSLRPRYLAMDRKTQANEIRKLIAAPDYMVGSVHAVTESGDLVVASATASQLGPYASGAGRLILVVGSQKIVRNLDEAMRRIREYAFAYENARVLEQMGRTTFVGKVLIISREWLDGRTTVILVRQPVGV